VAEVLATGRGKRVDQTASFKVNQIRKDEVMATNQ